MALSSTERSRQRRAALCAMGRPTKKPKPKHDLFEAPFLAWDGEGFTDENGVHHYTLLANSDGAELYRPQGISTFEALSFLSDHCGARGSHANRRNNVIFAGSYDVNMMLGDLDRNQLRRLWDASYPETMPCDGRLFRMRYRPRKEFFLARLDRTRPYLRDDVAKRSRPNIESSCSLWDVWGFFQSSFVKACEDNLTPAELERFDIATIREMKARRADFGRQDAEDVRKYCRLELQALVALMNHVREQMRTAGISVKRWDGAGAVSKAFLRKYEVNVHREETSESRRRVIASAYGGGRIEICKIGRHQGDIVDYDIASAYPAAALCVPSLAGATWRKSANPSRFSVSRLRFAFPVGLPWYPLPYRERSGAILFPSHGEGWYWKPEIDAALAFARQMGGTVTLKSALNCEPATDAKPFGWMAEMYDLRAQWKRTGVAGEKQLKLGLNGGYGACAQQVGAAPFFQLEWAGWMTSSTRAALVMAALRDPGAVAMFATDGIFCTRPLSGIESYGPGAMFGGWTAKHADEMVIAQAGVYWYRQGERWHAAYRGFDRDRMGHPSVAIDAWRRKETRVEIPTTRFVTMGSAVHQDVSWRLWRRWVTAPRVLDLTGSSEKRFYAGGARAWKPYDRLVPLAVKNPIDPIPGISHPYPVEAWGFKGRPSPYDQGAVEADEYDEADL